MTTCYEAKFLKSANYSQPDTISRLGPAFTYGDKNLPLRHALHLELRIEPVRARVENRTDPSRTVHAPYQRRAQHAVSRFPGSEAGESGAESVVG